jgi:hypothetical protein
MQSLVKIVLNTLDAQYHQCRRIPATLVMGVPPTHSRGKAIQQILANHEDNSLLECATISTFL